VAAHSEDARRCAKRNEGETTMTRCVGCRFYDRDERASADGGNLRWGSCRRSVPTLHPAPGRTVSSQGVWPRVRDDDWCGAWEARQTAVEPAVALDADSLLVAPNVARASTAVTNHFASD
jgi:hypothetical protein